MNGLILLFGIVFLLFVGQAVGAVFQIKDFQKSMKRVHRYGNIGIGQKKGGLTNGYLVVIACDSQGIITYGEHMTGMTVFSRCRSFDTLMDMPLQGTHIDAFMDAFRKLDKKGFRQMKGYIQAMDALERRLYPERFDPTELPKLSLEPRIHHRKMDLQNEM